ncbi:Aminodeoxychorismate lyase [Pseudidiomarina piscicola]|uniref:Aminodeoxychorismate lyase n=1 Tax=Pseudidiomarina piscicola TaxID=2614830 RepID=A0A6S6WJT3_9GAMM|nr:aminodeoxychorismate lyase [Pseudidiomarina piscicola]CAB0149909.1 Aminodeoxychorismate lyase [Pseudidiomarina piscicola]VZT39354.1 Aminodeoxychorismate lyase [Pseudomonas aeruginosa]
MWHNNREIPNQAIDRGLQFGDGHFTTLTIENGVPRWWSAHWQRLQEASRRLAMLLPEQAELLGCIKRLIEQHPQQNLVVKIIVTRGEGSRGYGAEVQSQANWYLKASPLPTRTTVPLNVAVAAIPLSRSPLLAGLKSLNRLEQVMLSQEKQQRQLDELIVLDTAGNVIEAISSNLLWRKGRQWFTPSLEYAGIAGVVRRQLLEQQPVDLQIVDAVSVNEFLQAEQVVLTNSVLGLRPVAQIGEHRLCDPHLPKALKSWWHESDVS